MTQEGFKRKLTAILSADVEGYSRLMGEDEESTVQTITAYREVITLLSKTTKAGLWIHLVTIFWLNLSAW